MQKHDRGIIGNLDVAPIYFDKDGNVIRKAAIGAVAPREYPVLTATRKEKNVTRTISAHGIQALRDIAKQYFATHSAPWVVSNGERFFS